MAPHLGVKKQFWGVNRRFQAKLAKSKNVHIIKTTASIPTKLTELTKLTNKRNRLRSKHLNCDALKVQQELRLASFVFSYILSDIDCVKLAGN